MIPFEVARPTVLSRVWRMPVVTVSLPDMTGRYLARSLTATADLPRFDSSAVDGYAVRVADVAGASYEQPTPLCVTGTIRAGESTGNTVHPGTAIKILTGAPVPIGTDAVIMREDTEEIGDTVRVRRVVGEGENIRRHGEEFRAGDEVLPAGTKLSPAAVGLLASFGLTQGDIYQPPRVALITTGDEVQPAGRELQPGQIYNSNVWALLAALRDLGIVPATVTHVVDDPSLIRAALTTALAASDVVITSGGVSVGDTDYVKDVLRELGTEFHFTKVAVKPGKPTCFGSWRASNASHRCLVFGLPGNPVAALLSFHHFVRPAIQVMMGAAAVEPLRFSARLLSPLRKNVGRMEFVRGKLVVQNDVWAVEPIPARDSHLLGGLAAADVLIHFASDLERLEAGAMVQIELINY